MAYSQFPSVYILQLVNHQESLRKCSLYSGKCRLFADILLNFVLNYQLFQDEKNIDKLAENTVVIAVNVADNLDDTPPPAGHSGNNRKDSQHVARHPSHASNPANDTRDAIAKVMILSCKVELLYNLLCHSLTLSHHFSKKLKTDQDRHLKLGTLVLHIARAILTQ